MTAGPIVAAEDQLALAIADSATFRAWVGAVDQAEALARVHHDALPRPADQADSFTVDDELALMPCVVLWTDEHRGFVLQSLATSDAFDFESSGRVAFFVWQEVPLAFYDDESAAERDFKTKLGGLFADLAAVAGLPGYLAIERLELVSGPMRAHENERFTQGRAQVALCAATWGTR